jgi:hypothetical protein
MASYDRCSFSAGQQSGARIAACIARLAALDLVDTARWWNRRRHRLMARTLIACAEEMELAADEDRESVHPRASEEVRHGLVSIA